MPPDGGDRHVDRAVPAGDVAVIEVAVLAVHSSQRLDPKSTSVAPVRLVPVIVTAGAPRGRAGHGATMVTVGAARRCSGRPRRSPTTPPTVVTTTSTVPEPDGAVTVIEVAESAVMAAGLPPKVTPVAPARLVPLTVTHGADRRRAGVRADPGDRRERARR